EIRQPEFPAVDLGLHRTALEPAHGSERELARALRLALLAGGLDVGRGEYDVRGIHVDELLVDRVSQDPLPRPLGELDLAHELGPALVLHLGPGAAPATGLVDGVEALGDDPLEALLGAGLEESAAVAAVPAGGPPRRAVQLQLLEARAPLLVREPHQRAAVEI